MTNIQALGICRFSYDSSGGFAYSSDDLEKRRQFLFDPKRMDERFTLFEHITLPSLRAQTDPDFLVVIVTSMALPEIYLERLFHLIKDIPQIAVDIRPPQGHAKAMRKAIAPYKDMAVDAVAHFRIDDDDAVACDFVQLTKQLFPECQEAFEADGKAGLDFSKGILLETSHENLRAQPRKIKLTGISQAVFLPPQVNKSSFAWGHYRLDDFMQVHVDPRQEMFVRSFNNFNDSRMLLSECAELPAITAHTKKRLRARFGIDADALETALNRGDAPPQTDQ
ncbi:DNA-directed RNA polymerase subunit beta' [Amylibacter marinus]|uniref:DNA-directed RNA polymerase subunit beta n=1 Tax=Amylibacter marinus TaxID=1475483 RepID=A0ABQ5VXA7_9RHOB|nr:glycosyltransferase [Amylibacter marinus]GLQ35837.1 DNA-directed RNA polymerase subunit beta' [Amylibacter marinus]